MRWPPKRRECRLSGERCGICLVCSSCSFSFFCVCTVIFDFVSIRVYVVYFGVVVQCGLLSGILLYIRCCGSGCVFAGLLGLESIFGVDRGFARLRFCCSVVSLCLTSLLVAGWCFRSGLGLSVDPSVSPLWRVCLSRLSAIVHLFVCLCCGVVSPSVRPTVPCFWGFAHLRFCCSAVSLYLMGLLVAGCVESCSIGGNKVSLLLWFPFVLWLLWRSVGVSVWLICTAVRELHWRCGWWWIEASPSLNMDDWSNRGV